MNSEKETVDYSQWLTQNTEDDEVLELDAAELEEVIAPGLRMNHNETLAG